MLCEYGPAPGTQNTLNPRCTAFCTHQKASYIISLQGGGGVKTPKRIQQPIKGQQNLEKTPANVWFLGPDEVLGCKLMRILQMCVHKRLESRLEIGRDASSIVNFGYHIADDYCIRRYSKAVL